MSILYGSNLNQNRLELPSQIHASSYVSPHAASISLALNVEDITNVGGQLGLPTSDPVTTVLNLIQYALSLLGIIAVIMVIIGGFMWLMSLGNEDRLVMAKRTISGAIVGLVIVLPSWAIVSYIINGVNTAAN
ncbi:MAG: pilin [Patescibacteria group bacterium]|jgi:type IV secretory pathway VirB2 component (pilin)